MMELVTDGGLLAEAEVHPMIVGAVKDMHFRTWFVSQYADGRFLASTTAGRRPAKSWADAIFAYLFSRILDTIAEVANGEGLFGELSHDEEVGPFAGPGDGTPELAREEVWADDAVFPVSDPCPIRMVGKAHRLASVVISACEGHGLTPNLQQIKTSFLIHLVGKGKSRARHLYFGHGKLELRLQDLRVSLVAVGEPCGSFGRPSRTVGAAALLGQCPARPLRQTSVGIRSFLC